LPAAVSLGVARRSGRPEPAAAPAMTCGSRSASAALFHRARCLVSSSGAGGTSGRIEMTAWAVYGSTGAGRTMAPTLAPTAAHTTSDAGARAARAARSRSRGAAAITGEKRRSRTSLARPGPRVTQDVEHDRRKQPPQQDPRARPRRLAGTSLEQRPVIVGDLLLGAAVRVVVER